MKFYLSIVFTILVFQIGMAQETADVVSNNKVYTFVEQMPVFGNCDEFMVENERNACTSQQMMLYVLRKIETPKSVEDLNIGEIIVRFIVDENGDVQNPTILKGINEEFDAMYLNIFKTMPKWQAGKEKDKNVKVEITLPMKVHF